MLTEGDIVGLRTEPQEHVTLLRGLQVQGHSLTGFWVHFHRKLLQNLSIHPSLVPNHNYVRHAAGAAPPSFIRLRATAPYRLAAVAGSSAVPFSSFSFSFPFRFGCYASPWGWKLAPRSHILFTLRRLLRPPCSEAAAHIFAPAFDLLKFLKHN